MGTKSGPPLVMHPTTPRQVMEGSLSPRTPVLAHPMGKALPPKTLNDISVGKTQKPLENVSKSCAYFCLPQPSRYSGSGFKVSQAPAHPGGTQPFWKWGNRKIESASCLPLFPPGRRVLWGPYIPRSRELGVFLLPKVSGSFLYPSHPPWMWALPQAVATWRALCPEKERALGKDQHSVSSRVSALLPCVLTGDFPHCSPGLGRGDGTQG